MEDTTKKSFKLNPEGKKQLTPTEVLNMRKKLVENYGNKIMFEEKPDWTMEEKVAAVSYQEITKILYEMVPDMKGPDEMYRLYIEYDAKNIFELGYKLAIKKGAKPFLFVLSIVLLIALLKYIFQP